MTRLIQFRQALDRLSHSMALIGAYALLAASLLICFDVVMRKFWSSPITGADEISGYALALTISWAAAYALFRGSHLRVDVLYRLFPIKLRAWLDVVAVGTLLTFGIILAWQGTELMIEALSYGKIANSTLRTPLWIPQLFWVGGLSFFVISCAATFTEGFIRVITGDHSGAIALINPQQELDGVVL